MKPTILEQIKRAVEEAKKFPNPTIEYNYEKLPKEVKPDNFFGVKAKFNKDVASINGYSVTFTY